MIPMSPHRMGILLVALVLSGCSLLAPVNATSPIRYFVLTEAGDLNRIADLPGLRVGVGPIRVPEYLRRLALVQRVDENRVAYSDLDRWAEPLDGNFQRVLADDLAVLLRTRRLALFPWYQTAAPDRRISIDVQRFEQTPAGGVRLWARWTLRDNDGGRLVSGEFDQVRKVDGDGDAVVAAMSELTGDLARDIAVAIAESV
jgi:uncharacterized lipoprotein YmbA